MDPQARGEQGLVGQPTLDGLHQPSPVALRLPGDVRASILPLLRADGRFRAGQEARVPVQLRAGRDRRRRLVPLHPIRPSGPHGSRLQARRGRADGRVPRRAAQVDRRRARHARSAHRAAPRAARAGCDPPGEARAQQQGRSTRAIVATEAEAEHLERLAEMRDLSFASEPRAGGGMVVHLGE